MLNSILAGDLIGRPSFRNNNKANTRNTPQPTLPNTPRKPSLGPRMLFEAALGEGSLYKKNSRSSLPLLSPLEDGYEGKGDITTKAPRVESATSRKEQRRLQPISLTSYSTAGQAMTSPRHLKKKFILEENVFAVAEESLDDTHAARARTIEGYLEEDAAGFWVYLKEQYLEENLLAWQTMGVFLADPHANPMNGKEAIYDVYFSADTMWNVSVPIEVSLELDFIFQESHGQAPVETVSAALQHARNSLQPALIANYQRFRQV